MWKKKSWCSFCKKHITILEGKTLTQKHFTLQRTKAEKGHAGTDREHLSLLKYTSALEHISITLLIFSLALITGDKPLKPALQENLQLCDRGAYQNARRAGFGFGNLSRLGVKRPESLKWYRNMCFSFFKEQRKRERGAWKKRGLNCCFGSVSSGYEFKLGYWIREYCCKVFDSAWGICLKPHVSPLNKQTDAPLRSLLWKSARFKRTLSVTL